MSRKTTTFKLSFTYFDSLKPLTLTVLLLTISLSVALRYVNAQSIPLVPPPFPESTPQEEKKAENDSAPPKIEILTTELHEGKNVFSVKISDESSLHTREVKYVHDGQLRVDGLFRDRDDVYKALIDIKPPSRIVEVTAGDANGNVASEFKEYEITKSLGIFILVAD